MSENKGVFYKIKDDIKQAFLFRDQVKEVLFHEVVANDVDDKEALARLVNWRAKLESANKFHKVGDVQITGNPSEVAEALRKEVEVYREPLSNEQIVIANLRHDLLVANKVIARLVGE